MPWIDGQLESYATFQVMPTVLFARAARGDSAVRQPSTRSGGRVWQSLDDSAAELPLDHEIETCGGCSC